MKFSVFLFGVIVVASAAPAIDIESVAKLSEPVYVVNPDGSYHYRFVF